MLLCKRSPYELPTGVAAARCLYSCWEFVGDVKFLFASQANGKQGGCMSGESTAWFSSTAGEWVYPAGAWSWGPSYTGSQNTNLGRWGRRGAACGFPRCLECPLCGLAAFALLLRGLLLPRDLLGRVQRRHGRAFFPAITRSKSLQAALDGPLRQCSEGSFSGGGWGGPCFPSSWNSQSHRVRLSRPEAIQDIF